MVPGGEMWPAESGEFRGCAGWKLQKRAVETLMKGSATPPAEGTKKERGNREIVSAGEISTPLRRRWGFGEVPVRVYHRGEKRGYKRTREFIENRVTNAPFRNG